VGLARLPATATVPRWALAEDAQGALWTVARSLDELSIICGYDEIPGSVVSVGPFVPFSVDGPLDHDLVGVLAGLLAPIAAAGIPVMAESTYDTDWILVPVPHVPEAVAVWSAAGHTIDVASEEES
jgi:hypothetical protein